MAMKFEIDVERMKDVVRYLQGMQTRVEDFTIPLTDAAKLLYSDVMGAIASEGASWGDSWAPMATSTEERWGAHDLLHLTGALESSFQYFVRPFIAGVATRDPVEILMEHGRTSGWRSVTTGNSRTRRRESALAGGDQEMPARVALGFDEDSIDVIMEMILDYAVDKQGAE